MGTTMASTSMPSKGTARPLPAIKKFSHHISTSISNIDSQTCHKAVNLLRNLQKSNGTQKPDKDITGDRFFFPVHLQLAVPLLL